MRFRLRLWPTLGTIVGVVLLATLGTWQFDRYQAKREIEQLRQERIATGPTPVASLDDLPGNYSTVELQGEVSPEHLFLFKHRTRDGKPGGWLGGIVRLEDNQAILVNLGWVHREQYDRLSVDILEQYDPPLTGLLHQPERIVADEKLRRRLDDRSGLPDGEVLELDSYDLEGLQQHFDGEMPELPAIVVLDQTHTKQPFPVASYDHVTEPYLTAERHLSYSIFWYVTGLALLSMYLAYGFGYLGRAMQSRRPSRGES